MKNKSTYTQKVQNVAAEATEQSWLSANWHYILVALFSFLLYANTLGHQFVLDDPLAITKNDVVKGGVSSIGELLMSNYRKGTEAELSSAPSYRPLSLIVYAVGYSMFGDSPMGFHLLNCLLYAGLCILVYIFLKLFFSNRSILWPLTLSLVFAAHPLHTEVVANIKSLDEILALGFSVWSILLWHNYLMDANKKWLIYGLISYLLALLSKESAITFLPAYLFIAFYFYDHSIIKSVKKGLVFLLPIIIFLFLRHMALKDMATGSRIDIVDNQLIVLNSPLEKLANSAALLYVYVTKMLVPYPLVADYSLESLPYYTWGHKEAVIGLSLFFVLCGLAVVSWKKKNTLGLASIMLLSTLSISLQIVMIIGTLFAERLTFAPSLWITVILGLLLSKIMERYIVSDKAKEKVFIGLMISFTAVFSFLTFTRNLDWYDNLTLFKTDIEKNPNSIRLNNGYASELYNTYLSKKDPLLTEQKVHDEMLRVSAIANKVKRNPISYLNSGIAHLLVKDYDLAISSFKSSMDSIKNFAPALINLRNTYSAYAMEEGREKNNLAKAEMLYKEAIKLGDPTEDMLINLGTALAMQNKTAEALPYFEQVTVLNPQNKAAWGNLFTAAVSLGHADKAARAKQMMETLK
jgi:protein O-mannosyl-transferase